MLHLVYGINSLDIFVNLILVPVPPFTTHLCLHPSLLPLLIHHSAHPQLPLSFTPGLKPTSFTNPNPRSSTSPPRTALTNFWPYRFFWSPRFLFSVFLIFFVSVPCARFGWPFRHLMSARKYIVSYRIVPTIRYAAVYVRRHPVT